ncbi:HAD hydrolase-like protein [uncultured Gulosibacter sp.]|uniref:HAD hydrolase-like protein n=1 Tax=uncultured Gulosibacter sp. TaxID=1339167 RepID=UPI00288B41CA|nr:HAD hydrolase-like protein [uncultured Gulosibacter sp.]
MTDFRNDYDDADFDTTEVAPDAPLLEEVDPQAQLREAAREAEGNYAHPATDTAQAADAAREVTGDAPAGPPLHRTGDSDGAGRFSPASITVVHPEATEIETDLTQPAFRPVTPVDFTHGTGAGPYTAVLWDLDGTISDSAAGIITAMRKTFDTFRMPIPSEATLLSYVGPPIIDSFKREHLDDAIEVQHALQTYREIHDELGLEGTPPFAGIPEIIRALHAAGIPQSTATSKPESGARRVLHHYELLNEFAAITGASEDESRSKKEDVVAEALRRLDALGVDLSNVLMIGDRFYDVQGSAQHGVPCVYVTWGYGRTGEDEGAVAVVNTAAQLAKILGVQL